jgi:hypothetical protein
MDNHQESPPAVGLEQAKHLVEEYRQVTAGVAGLLASGAPETLLPAPRDAMRQAILAVARQACAFNPEDVVTLDRLRSAYASLASFLPYDQALAATRLVRALETGDRAYMASAEALRAMTRARQIEVEAAHLGREFDRFVCKQHMAEFDGLDAYLDRLAQKYIPAADG